MPIIPDEAGLFGIYRSLPESRAPFLTKNMPLKIFSCAIPGWMVQDYNLIFTEKKAYGKISLLVQPCCMRESSEQDILSWKPDLRHRTISCIPERAEHDRDEGCGDLQDPGKFFRIEPAHRA